MTDSKVAVITGAAKGIGAAAAKVFHREGYSVGLLDIDEAGQQVADALGERAIFIPTDVANETACKNAVDAIVEKFGAVTALINNAGIQRYSTVTETTEEEWDLVLGVNLKSAFLMAKHCIPHMLEAGSGTVINLSSVQAFASQNKVAPYTTSKTALLGLTRSIAVDYAPKVRCMAICPGTVDTPMLRWAIEQSPDPEAVLQECIDMHPVGRLGSAEEIGELALYLCSEKAGFMTGREIRIDGGLGLSIAGSKQD